MTRQSFEMDLLLGFADVATRNEEAEVPLWAGLTPLYDEDAQAYIPRAGTLPEGAVGIYLNVAPEARDSVTLTEYSVSDDLSLSDSVMGVQVRIRCADRDRVMGIQSDLFALFHGRWGGMLGRVTLVSARRASGTNVGQDSEQRQGRIENYYATVHRPSTHRF